MPFTLYPLLFTLKAEGLKYVVLCQRYLWRHQSSCLPTSGKMPASSEAAGSFQDGAKVL